MTFLVIIQYINIVAFAVFAVFALQQWQTHGGGERAWFFLTFAILSSVTILGKITPQHRVEGWAGLAQIIELLIISLFPYALYRFGSHFTPSSRRVHYTAVGLTISTLLTTAIIPPEYFSSGDPPPVWFIAWIALFLTHWSFASAVVAIRLWKGGSQQPNTIRLRTRSMSLGALGLAAAILFAGAVASNDTILTDIIIQSFALLSLILFGLGYAPPAFLRRVWRGGEEAKMRAATARIISAESHTEAIDQILPAISAVVGGWAIAFLDTAGTLVASHGDAPDTMPPLAELQRPAGSQERVITVSRERVDVFLDNGYLLIWTNPYTPFFGTEELQLLQSLSVFMDLIFDRERRQEEARLRARAEAITDTLQQGVLPDILPELPEVELAARYIPAQYQEAVGGDWYDVFGLEANQIVVAIGDVMGKGVVAASVMGQLRNALRAYFLEGHDPEVAVAYLNRCCLRFANQHMTTLVVGVFDTETREFTYVCAGHLPPLVLDADGAAHYLENIGGLPLGVDDAMLYQSSTVVLEPGSTILLYTDGLVERRKEALEDRLDIFKQLIEAGPDDIDELASYAIAASLPTGAGDDDTALLLLRSKAIAVDGFDLILPALPESLPTVRNHCRSWLEGLQVDSSIVFSILLAAGEACTNAVEHAYSMKEASFKVSAHYHGDYIVITIRDFGKWRSPRGENRGRGVGIMQAIMDKLDIQRTETGTLVTMRKEVDLPAGTKLPTNTNQEDS